MGLVHLRYQILRPLRRFVRRDNGFTLTDLVIAMVVLGVLASIAVPSFLGSRNNAYDKEAQSSIENVLKAAKFQYQSQSDFSDGSSAQCGDSTALAADLQKLEPNVDVVASSFSSTNSRIVSVQAVQTWDSTGGLLGCQGFYAVALSSSGSCWAARIILEGKYLASSSVSPVVVKSQTNTSNNAVTTWSALAVNGNAFGVLKPQSSAADGDNTNNLVALKTACKARTQSTGVADLSGNYIAPSQFYSSWRDVVASPYIASAANCVTTDTCVLGATGPGGGTVFYVSATNFTSTGSACGTACKYLEYAPTGWIVSTTPAGQTNCSNSSPYAATPGTSSNDPLCLHQPTAITPYARLWPADCSGTCAEANIGSGHLNTTTWLGLTGMLAGYASTVARAYQGGGMTDWYLPSKNELNQLCRDVWGLTVDNTATTCSGMSGTIRAGFASNWYASSTEWQSNGNHGQTFLDGTTANRGKSNGTNAVRPIRAFG